jgi:LCP family protein required for cell wall assembly
MRRETAATDATLDARARRRVGESPLSRKMSRPPVTPINDERPSSPGWSMLKRFTLAAVVIVALSAGATATVALNTVSGIAEEVFPKVNLINAPKGVVTPVYSGGPQTFLILGTDRRTGSKDAADRENPPHSDTMLLVRLDPERGQTSIMSIPRDLMVNITAPGGQLYGNEKINAAYTIGSRASGAKGGIVLAAETIEKQVFPGLKLNGILDVNFQGFIKVVDTLGCAYVNVDHHYFNFNNGSAETNYSSINLQPGYQKLCYQNALDYVRYRHTDSDFVRVARQQDFLRNLREQISPEDVLGQIDTVAKAVGQAINSTFHASTSELLELAKLVAFSQAKPIRQVRFLTTNVDLKLGGGSYVTSTPELEARTLHSFLYGHETLQLQSVRPPAHSPGHGRHSASTAGAPVLGLTASSGEGEAVKAAFSIPFPMLYPRLQTSQSEQQTVRAYTVLDRHGHRHHAYVVVWQQSVIGGYYDFEGTDWLNPPLFAHAHTQSVGPRTYRIVDDGSHIHVVGWRSGRVLYWITNTLLEELSNAQMLALAASAQPLH